MGTEYLFKVIVIGEANVGKTSIIKRYVENTFSHKYRYTIGVDFALKVVDWDKDTIVRLQLWDIAGQERFGVMTHVYYREAAAAVIVFDISQRKTFDAVIKWKKDVEAKVHLDNGQPVPTLLLANKSDLEHAISNEEIDRFCKDNGFIGWFDTSAKTNFRIDAAMKFLISTILSAGHGVTRTDGLKLEDEPQPDTRKPAGCCGGGGGSSAASSGGGGATSSTAPG